jgi:hypothetical protein
MANLNEIKEGMNKVVKPIYGFQAYIIKDPLLIINEIKKNSKTDTIDSMVAYQKCLKNKKYFIYPYMVSTDMIKYKSLVRN